MVRVAAETLPAGTIPPHTHVYGEWEITKEATCVTDGAEERICACGVKETRKIDRSTLVHIEGKWIVDKKPTKDAPGSKHTECTVCGERIKEESIPVTGSVGLQYAESFDGYYCTVTGIGTCNDTQIIIPDTISGKEVVAIAKEAFKDCRSITEIFLPNTITSIGDSAVYGCTGLATIYFDGTMEEWRDVSKVASWHADTSAVLVVCTDGTMGEWKTTKEPTCTQSGTKERICSCGEKEIGVISVVPHDFGEWTVMQEPTCTAKGLKERVCGCSAKESGTIPVNPSAHKYATDWTTDNINHWNKCQNSGCTAVSDKIAHTFGEWIVDEVATCVKPGTRHHVCTVCNKSVSETYSDANAHNYATAWTSDDTNHWHKCQNSGCTSIADEITHAFGEWIVDEAATCMTTGTRHHVCTVCNKSISESYSDANAHNYATAWATDNADHWHVCQNSGCASMLEKAAHSWDKENTCTVCQKYKDDGVKFYKLSKGTYEVSNYTGSASEVIIPSTYKGVAVTSIGSSAFERCDSLTSITIPNSVTSIDAYAFYWCTSLASITIPDSVTSIGTCAFTNCNSLMSITIPSSITRIGYGAFSDCDGLTSVTIPSSVTSIDDYAFSDCTGLTSIIIPDSVKSFGWYAFSGCASLTSITIPDSVKSFGYGAFSGCTSLTSVTIPSSVTSIDDYAFANCTSLTSVTIPNSVTSIGYRAFFRCTSLASIIYGGTKTQWENITKGDEWLDNTPTITVTCTDGTLKYN